MDQAARSQSWRKVLVYPGLFGASLLESSTNVVRKQTSGARCSTSGTEEEEGEEEREEEGEDEGEDEDEEKVEAEVEEEERKKKRRRRRSKKRRGGSR